MNEYPPGEYVSRAQRTLPMPGPDQPLRSVEIDAGPQWGAFRITFAAKRNPRQGMSNWFWTMHRGERIEFGQPVPSGVVVDFVVGHEADAGTDGQPAVSSDRPKPLLEGAMTITDLIAALEQIKDEHGNLSIAEEKPLAWMAVQHVEVVQIPQSRALRSVPGVADGEHVVVIRS